MKTKSRILTIGESVKGDPKLTITGRYFTEMGFSRGDKVSLTNPEPGLLIIKVEVPAAIAEYTKREKELESGLLAAEAELHYHRTVRLANLQRSTPNPLQTSEA